jgi:predicted small secreted protein
MSFTAGTTTGGLSAARITPRESPRELIGKEREILDNLKLALAQAGSLWGSWLFIHLEAIVLQENHKSNNYHRVRK